MSALLDERESRPRARHPEPTHSISTAIKTETSLATAGDGSALHAHVVIVSSTDAKARRRVYLSLHSAERAVERAQARGHAATLHLCRLVPVLAPVDGEAAW